MQTNEQPLDDTNEQDVFEDDFFTDEDMNGVASEEGDDSERHYSDEEQLENEGIEIKNHCIIKFDQLRWNPSLEL